METPTPHAAPCGPQAGSRKLPSRRGFTLTELLVVITIIAILAALATVGVMGALTTGKQTAIKLELDNIDMALKAYKEKYGSYPPCDLRFDPAETDQTKPTFNAFLMNHVARAFPRYPLTRARLASDLTTLGIDTANFRPDQALVFWLHGFGPDPSNPFDPNAVKTPFFEFNPTRVFPLTTSFIPVPAYFPPGVKPDATGAPYLYWEPGQVRTTTMGMTTTITSNYGTITIAMSGTTAAPFTFNASASRFFQNAGTATPYWFDPNKNNLDPMNNNTVETTETWVNPDSFQLISSGLDGKYGSDTVIMAKMYPTGTHYDSNDLVDDDNVTNFSRRARLGDDKP